MTSLNKVFVHKPPIECVWARCGCGWWVAPEKQIGKWKCWACGIIIMKATNEDFEAIGVELDEQVRTNPRGRKGNKRT